MTTPTIAFPVADSAPASDTASPDTVRRIFGHYPAGVVCVAAEIDGRPVGLLASSFTTVSWEPPLVSFCIQNTSGSWPDLQKAARIGISILADHHRDVTRQLSSRKGERFADIDYRTTADGAVLLNGAPAWFECSVHDQVAAGDHTIILLRIQQLGEAEHRPLLYHRSGLHSLAAS